MEEVVINDLKVLLEDNKIVEVTKMRIDIEVL